MPWRAGAKGSITGTTVCLPRPALQHNLGASARDSSKWLPGAWRALTCSPGLLLGPLIASLLRVGQSFPPECPSCPTAASGKKHSEWAECCDWVQRGTKTQAELSSYSKAMHTSVSKCQLQQHAAFPSSYCHGSYNPTPHQTRVCPGLWTPPGSSTFRWMNVPEHPLGHWPKEGDKLVSTPLHPALRSSRLLLILTAQQQKTSAMPCSNTNSCSLHRRLRIILLWPPSSSSLWSAHRTPQAGTRPSSPASNPRYSICHVLAFFSTQLMHQGHSPSATEPRVFHPSDSLTKGSLRGSEPVTWQSFEHNAPWDYSFFFPLHLRAHREPRVSLPRYFWMRADPPLPLPLKMSDIADRPAPGIWLPSRLSVLASIQWQQIPAKKLSCQGDLVQTTVW